MAFCLDFTLLLRASFATTSLRALGTLHRTNAVFDAEKMPCMCRRYSQYGVQLLAQGPVLTQQKDQWL